MLMCTHVPETMSDVIIRSRFETISICYYFREKEKEMDKMNGKHYVFPSFCVIKTILHTYFYDLCNIMYRFSLEMQARPRAFEKGFSGVHNQREMLGRYFSITF